MAHLEGVSEDRQNWGPWSDAKRTISERFKDFSSQKPDFCLIDESSFEVVIGPGTGLTLPRNSYQSE